MESQKRKTIMLVDDNPVNLNMGRKILKDYYEVYALPSAERLFKFLESVSPDLLLLDVAMPGISGFDVIKILKSNSHHTEVPVIFVTSKREEKDELEGLALGAVDYVTKPFSAAILLKRIENHLLIEKQKAELKNFNNNLVALVDEKTEKILELQNLIISSVAEIVEFRDVFTGEHVNRTKKYVELLVNYLVEHNTYTDEILAWDDIDNMISSTQLHDLGKVFISDAVLNKPGKLTPEEFEIMKTHAAKGADAIKKMRMKGGGQTFLEYAEIAAGTHHEKWDGTGYPAGLKGSDIPLIGRLMAVADVYDALISVRPYKTPFSAAQAAKIIIEGSGTHFDPVLVDVFKELEGEFASVAKEANAQSAETLRV